MKVKSLWIGILFVLPLVITAQRSRNKNSKPAITISDSLYTGLQWRNIGPFRGGRSVASTGVVGQPMTYFMGTTGGGIWKTVDDGITWENCSDGQLGTGTVGALAVSESNSNLMLAGMGEHAARGVMTSMGDGVYKSTDGGETWKHFGLDETRHIADVIIHPTNPDILFVAAQGAQYGPSEERGVYRSLDGGQNWERVLYVDDRSGAASLSMDFNNPLVLYAALWDHRRYPWTMESGGPGSGLYKSVDGGTTWKRLEKGLPKIFGKAGISVSRANPKRVFAVIEAEGEQGGVYRSDDAGSSWKQLNKDRINIARSWYYMEIVADPQDENLVYVLNAPVTKSIDGGKTFAPLPTPHTDNHHLWIDPHNNKRMINSNDGGANVSNNGGLSWSSQQNQATAQFYRVITDNLVPYNIYGGQQDNSAIAIASRTSNKGIGWKDWYSVAGCESAFLAFDPNDPAVVYGGCYQGIIDKWSKTAQTWKPIKEYPELGLGKVPKDFKYRYNWNAPIIISPQDPNTIYHAGNVVFKTNDGGQQWTVISPDLTRNEKAKQGPGGGPYTNEAAGGENYNTLSYLAASPLEVGVLYAGSDDGLLHLTKNGGQQWTDITPPGIGRSIINSIAVSPHDPATAYVVAMGYKHMDLSPYIFKTSDYGNSWTKITKGITGKHTFVRVVRADKKKKGLLYAGTETGLYLSFDDGQNWQPLQLNLPVVPINDIALQDNDLIVATAGRSFWVLDDLGPLQHRYDGSQSFQIVTPKPTYRLFGGYSEKPIPGWGQNPKSGVTLDYYLPETLDSTTLTLVILHKNEVIRTFTNQKPKAFKSWPGGPPKPQLLPSKKGYNRFTWDFRKATLPAIDNVFVFGDYRGFSVAPGEYTLRLILGEETVSTTVMVLPDPKIKATPKAYADQQEVLDTIDATLKSIHLAVRQMRHAKAQLQSHKKLLENRAGADSLLKQGKRLLESITSWEEQLIQPNQKTFQDVINFHNQLNADLMHLKSFVDVPQPQVTEGAKERLRDLLAIWKGYEDTKKRIIEKDMATYDRLYQALKLPALILTNE
ncbi:MAG: glycosyl hydrolase [Bacteroidota bacterium]